MHSDAHDDAAQFSSLRRARALRPRRRLRDERHWNEGENAFWACMGQWARDRDTARGHALKNMYTSAETCPRRAAGAKYNLANGGGGDDADGRRCSSCARGGAAAPSHEVELRRFDTVVDSRARLRGCRGGQNSRTACQVACSAALRLDFDAATRAPSPRGSAGRVSASPLAAGAARRSARSRAWRRRRAARARGGGREHRRWREAQPSSVCRRTSREALPERREPEQQRRM